MSSVMVSKCYRNLAGSLPLITFMANRQRHSGVTNTVLGSAWNVLNPLAQLGIYYFLVEIVFKRAGDYPVKPALFIIVGVSHFLFIQRTLVLAAGSIFKNDKLLLQVRMEPLVFIGVVMKQTLADLRISLILCIGFFVVLGMPDFHAGLLLYPVLMIFLMALVWAWAVILATLSVYSRDLPNTLSIVMRLMIYSTPVVYPATMLEGKMRMVIEANPLTGWFSMMHWSVFGSELPSVASVVTFVVFTLLSLIASHVLYTRLEPRFTKVM